MEDKHLWLGNLWTVVIYCSSILLMIGIICFTIFSPVQLVWNNSIIKKEFFIILVGLMILLLAVLVWIDKDLWSYVVCSEKGIFLKRHGVTLQFYSQDDIRISYKVLYYRRRYIESLHACLVIGGDAPSSFYIFDKNLRKSDFFAIPLTEKRFDQIVTFFRYSIELPDEIKSVEWKSFGSEDIEKFYKKIEEYNKII